MSHVYGFSTSLGYGLLVVSIIVGLILLFTKRKIFPLLYTASAALYAYGISFTIDRFHLSKTWILILLIFSGILMILIGMYLRGSSKKYKGR
ncbi:MAG: hypothetical protein AABX59_03620 [Nanoarchaeota archaeon]